MSETEPQRQEQVNSYTEEEGKRIRNESSKVEAPEGYCPSPQELREEATRILDIAVSLMSCTHSNHQRYVGAITWCTRCGAIRSPAPTPRSGVPVADTDWEKPGLVGRL